MEELIKISKEMKEATKETSYKYKYLKEIIEDEEFNEKYGEEREGYEKFRKDLDVSVYYSGEFSLRKVESRNSTNSASSHIPDYIVEQKIVVPISSKSRELFLKAKEIFIKELNIKDLKTLEMWIQEYGDPSYDPRGFYSSIVLAFIKTIEEYKECEDTKYYLDKIFG